MLITQIHSVNNYQWGNVHVVLASRTQWEFYKLPYTGCREWGCLHGSWALEWGVEFIMRWYAISMLLVSIWQWLQMMHIGMQTSKMVPCHETVTEHNCARLRCGKVCLLPVEHWDCGSKIVALIVTYTFIFLICSVPPLSPLASFRTVLFIVLSQLTISFSCMLIAVNHRTLWINSKLSSPCLTHCPPYFKTAFVASI